jgi:hypothetical protein
MDWTSFFHLAKTKSAATQLRESELDRLDNGGLKHWETLSRNFLQTLKRYFNVMPPSVA